MGEDSLSTTRASLDLTHVVYDPNSNFSLLLALFTLSPILLNASYAALLVQTRELTIAFMWAGQMACEVSNHIIKDIIKQPRPYPELLDGYGFPSSHSQWMGYFASFCACHLYFHHRFSPSGAATFDFALRLGAYAGLFTWTGAVAYSRYYLQYHTSVQVLSGLALGALFGAAYFALVELWPVRAPESAAGRVRSWLVGNPVSTWLRVRDGWAVWDDGGFESAWGVWRREWERRRASKGGKKRS